MTKGDATEASQTDPVVREIWLLASQTYGPTHVKLNERQRLQQVRV